MTLNPDMLGASTCDVSEVGFAKGVPYSLALREDFNFEDAAQMFPDGCSERLASSKSEGSGYHDALLPHQAGVLRMSAEREAGNRSCTERGESLRAPQGWVPPLTPMAKSRVYMNFLRFHAPAEQCDEALKVGSTWSAKTIRNQLAKNACYLILQVDDGNP